MATNLMAARDTLLQYIESKISSPPDPAELVVDTFYDDLRAATSPEDLPAIEDVITRLKESASAKIS
jgi:hypothetical protein